jgi:hypothetical protein
MLMWARLAGPARNVLARRQRGVGGSGNSRAQTERRTVERRQQGRVTQCGSGFRYASARKMLPVPSIIGEGAMHSFGAVTLLSVSTAAEDYPAQEEGGLVEAGIC